MHLSVKLIYRRRVITLLITNKISLINLPPKFTEYNRQQWHIIYWAQSI